MANLTSISITQNPNKIEYFSGELFDSIGLQVMANYDDDSSLIVIDYILNVPEILNNGITNIIRDVTVSYYEGNINKTTLFQITIKPILLTSILVSYTYPVFISLPELRNYYYSGEEFYDSGITVIANYNSGATKNIGDYTTSQFDMINNSSIDVMKTIIVSYTEKGIMETGLFSITIKSVSVQYLEINKLPTKTEYFLGEIFDPDGLIVVLRQNNGNLIPTTDYILSSPNMNSIGAKTVTVYRENISTKFDITVKAMPTLADRVKEYWQHFRFRMPDQNTTITLKWIERKFLIDFIYSDSLIKSASLKDRSQGNNYLPQYRMPYYAYPKYENENIIKQNVLELQLRLSNIQLAIFKDNKTYLQDVYTGKTTILDNPIVTADVENSRITYNNEKKDIKIYLNIMTRIGNEFVRTNYGEGSYTITPGRYIIRLRSASGGAGGDYGDKDKNYIVGDLGQQGGEIEFIIDNDETINITYGLSSRGIRGSGGTAPGGGGAAGNSYLNFDSPVNINGIEKRSIYCLGGSGGRGHTGKKGHQAGNGGQSSTNGNGRDGDDGHSGEKVAVGYGGMGGMGFSTDCLSNKDNCLTVQARSGRVKNQSSLLSIKRIS